jgi:hypothetical protein
VAYTRVNWVDGAPPYRNAANLNTMDAGIANVDSRVTALEAGTVTANSQTGTAYTLVLADVGKVVEMTNAAANTATIPPTSSVSWPVGTVIEIYQGGAGQTTVAPGSGVTLRAPDGAKIAKQYASASLRMRANDEWIIAGATSA